MSLYQLTELMDVEVLTYFKNCHLRGIHTEDLYADDNKIDKETGKVYKFSVLDTERNLFTYYGNTFLPKLKVNPRARLIPRLDMLGYYKSVGARPKLTGSHKTIAEELECNC